MNKKRTIRRIFKKYPLFVEEFSREKLGDISHEEISRYVQAKPKKVRKKVRRHKKTSLRRYGRYPLMEAALTRYHSTGNLFELVTAQQLRNRMCCDYLFLMVCRGESRVYRMPATASLAIVKQVQALVFDSWDDLDTKWDVLTRYGYQ